jgi:hypothetical protein
VTADGSGYAQYLAGQAPAAPIAGCGGPEAVAAGGSTTTVPTRVAIAGGPGLGQFHDDGTLAGNCSVFNFNPYNYYQTPLERYNGTVLASLDVSEDAEVYSASTTARRRFASRSRRRVCSARATSRRSRTR